MYIKKEKGITLIALVITIIVLLILAGIAIAALSGENGILTRASEAKQKTGREEIVEKAKLEILEKQTEKQRDLTDEEAMAIIAKYDKDYDENTNFNFKINENSEEYFITKNGYNILVKEIWDNEIHFTIKGKPFVAKRGETWKNWGLRNKELINKIQLDLSDVTGYDDYSSKSLAAFFEDDGSPRDVWVAEVHEYMSILDENRTWYLWRR